MRKLAVAALAAVILASAGFGLFQLQQELSQAGEGVRTFPTPACNYDPQTGLPLPGSHPMCPPVALCPTCPVPTIPLPTIDFGPFKANPAAVLASPPQHRVGDAAAMGRSDCPAGWQALVSDTTGMSVCFPPEAKPYGPEPESGGYGWAVETEGGEKTWDEAAWILLPEGNVLIHRIGQQGQLVEHLESYDKVGTEVSGFPAERYHLALPDGLPIEEGVQEEFLYLVTRGQTVWEIWSQIRFGPGSKPLSGDDLDVARERLRSVVATVRLP